MNTLKYKNFTAKINIDSENKILVGTVAYINHIMQFEAETVTKLERKFHKTIDNYIFLCEKYGKEL